jgi:hypothetical protein
MRVVNEIGEYNSDHLVLAGLRVKSMYITVRPQLKIFHYTAADLAMKNCQF